MADIDAPHDIAEDELEVISDEPSVGAEVPEADALEQAQDVAASPTAPAPLGLRDGVPEADALEQSHPVAFDEDDDYR
jgi:hypothetical protein